MARAEYTWNDRRECWEKNVRRADGMYTKLRAYGRKALPVSVGGTAANLGLIAELEACGVTRRAVDERGQSALLGLQGVRAGVRACVAGIAARYSGVMTIARVSDMQQTAELLLAAL